MFHETYAWIGDPSTEWGYHLNVMRHPRATERLPIYPLIPNCHRVRQGGVRSGAAALTKSLSFLKSVFEKVSWHLLLTTASLAPQVIH